jgi:hypothetical protein
VRAIQKQILLSPALLIALSLGNSLAIAADPQKLQESADPSDKSDDPSDSNFVDWLGKYMKVRK